MLDPGQCVADAIDGVWGYKYQCDGSFIAHFGGVYDGEPFSYFIPPNVPVHFGPGDEPYEEANVMACCGEVDQPWDGDAQPQVAENCLLDFRQQACISLTLGLGKLIGDGTIPLLYKGKAIEIQNWLAQHTTECIAGLVDTNEVAEILMATWKLPADGPWAPDISDVYVTIDLAHIFDISAPVGERVECTSLGDNNDTFFGDHSSLPLTTPYEAGLGVGGGVLIGPVFGGAPITGAGDFASRSTACTGSGCSTASFSVGGGNWAIDRLELRGDGPMTVTNGLYTEALTDVRLELYSQALGQATVGGSSYAVPTGAAYFVAVGRVGGDTVTLLVKNATPIVGSLHQGLWSLEPFEVAYQDDLGNTWTLTVTSTSWL